MSLLQLISNGAQDVYLMQNYNIDFSNITYYSMNPENTQQPQQIITKNSNFIMRFKCINRKIDIEKNHNIICPIKLSEICKNEKYGKCDVCHYNISEESLLKLLNVNDNCPMCLSKWTNKILFKNK